MIPPPLLMPDVPYVQMREPILLPSVSIRFQATGSHQRPVCVLREGDKPPLLPSSQAHLLRTSHTQHILTHRHRHHRVQSVPRNRGDGTARITCLGCVASIPSNISEAPEQEQPQKETIRTDLAGSDDDDVDDGPCSSAAAIADLARFCRKEQTQKDGCPI